MTPTLLTFATVHPEVIRDPDEWAAQCERADRATARTVAAAVMEQQRREAEERANSIDSTGWAE